MTQVFFPFDAGAGADVTEDGWTKMAELWIDSGVVSDIARDPLNMLECYADATGLQVKVKSGKAWIVGHYYESTAEETLPIATADVTNPRIDLVILRIDWILNTIYLETLTGTPAAAPVAPTLTTSSTIHEMALAKVAVAASATTVASGDVTDERVYAGIADYNEMGRTIDFDSSMSASEIQAIINSSDHYIPPGETLVFQFADGTYTLLSAIEFKGFFGGGSLAISGNSGESGLHTNQAVYLDASASGGTSIVVSKCSVSVFIYNLKIEVDSSGYYIGVSISLVTNITISGCYTFGTVLTGICYRIGFSNAHIIDCYISFVSIGISSSEVAVLKSSNNQSTGTIPATGLNASSAIIFKSGTQPTGSVANEATANGGQIW